MVRRWRWAGLALAAMLCSPVALAGPPPNGMPDPKQMSGIPRADPNLSPGTVTVRCLDGGFDSPVEGLSVYLDAEAADGSVQEYWEQSHEQGRATFRGLQEHFGDTVVVRAKIGGQEVRSQPFVLNAQSGVALLLVAGAGAPGPATDPAAHGDPHGGQGAVPLPGKPFPLEDRPPGLVIVGALDLSHGDPDKGEDPSLPRGPIEGVEITMRATPPGESIGPIDPVDPVVLTATTDADGRASFEDLDTALPEGATIVVEAVLEADGEVVRSESFTLGETGYAVILTRGAALPDPGQGGHAGQGGQPGQPPGPAPTQRMQLPGPRVDKSLGQGRVRVILLDGHDQPVVDHPVRITSSEPGGEVDERIGRTDATGTAIIDDVPVGGDRLAQLRVTYDGAPYRSTLFEMPGNSGAVVAQRVYEATTDRTRVRSALQIDVIPRENDFAAISFMYAVYVDGDEALWMPGGMRLYGPVGTRSLKVLPESEGWLVHDGEAPWVEIHDPLPPGEELRLSFAVGLEHDGTLELEWSAPFPLVDGASLVTVPAELSVTHGVAGAPELNPHAGRNGKPLELYQLGHDRFQLRICDYLAADGVRCPIGVWGGTDLAIVVEGLPIRSRVWPLLGWSLLGWTTLIIVIGVALRPKVGNREALLVRRDALMAELLTLEEQIAGKPDDVPARRRKARVLQALDRIYRQLEALEVLDPRGSADAEREPAT